MLKYLRVPQDDQTMEIISSVLEETVGLIDIKKWSKCVLVDDFYELFHPYARSSKSISKLLGRAEHVYLIVVTLGEDLGNRAKEYFGKKEVFKGYILDRLGSFLVEEEVKKIDLEITRQCKEDGHATTHRYSPGYGDFSIKAQRTFFDLAKDTIPGLTISHGCLLSSEKTVSAIKGVIKSGY
ncbi:MAG: hypothetical protein DRH17_03555 [Deltaproteobacteria bacterium]|nr:MAG: hypothetical protein DRH17_03555 [Deltaproteobacteria bacterium]